MYTITVDQSKSVLCVQLGGMLTIAEVGDYIRDIRNAVVLNRLRTYAMIIDVADCPIQHQDVIAAMGEHMATMPKARSLAIVTGSSLARMQIRRLFKQTYARIVATQAEAQAWVHDGIEPAPPHDTPEADRPGAEATPAA